MLYNLPIESLEERYSAQWITWFQTEFTNLGVDFVTIYPKEGQYEEISNGEFLDVTGTHIFKFNQLAHLIRRGFNDGDVVFFHDLWFPGLEALFYIRDALGIDFKICGCLHAGTWDTWDFLTRKGMKRWAREIEHAWLKEVDMIFVATEFHRELLRNDEHLRANVRVTWFPMYLSPAQQQKEDIVVFPHRLAPEKRPEAFDTIRNSLFRRMPGWTFIKTKEACTTKQDYYATLTRSKIAVSTALQETWGIAQQEATILGCVPIVPNRLAYAEIYPLQYRYQDESQADEMILYFSRNYRREVESLSFQMLVEGLRMKGAAAIGNMVRAMREKGWRL